MGMPELMPDIFLPQSASGMRWFHTSEEYLSEWKPRFEFMAFTKETAKLGKVCPRCGPKSDPRKIRRLVRHKKIVEPQQWICKRLFCNQTWPVQYFPVVVEMSQDEWVFARIQQGAANPPTTAQRIMQAHVGGAWGGLPPLAQFGALEAMSNNNQAHRDGAVIAALSVYQQHQRQQQQQQWMDHIERLHAAEAQRAWAMAEQYFGVPQRAAQAARNERYSEMQDMARIMAKEMFAEAARNRSSNHT